MATSIALGMRLSTATELANATGIEGEISVVESEWRAVVHDGTTKGGHPVAKKSEVDALQNTVDQIPNTYLTKTDAQNTYLGKTAKAASATTADSATKATQDANGNVIATTYATVASMKNVVRSVNGTAADAAGNVSIPLVTNSKAYITATWKASDGSSWYRKWSDGFIEQGGQIQANTVTFPTAFGGANYAIGIATQRESLSGNWHQITSHSNTGFVFNRDGTAQILFWMASGY